jgi:hypothetical protein
MRLHIITLCHMLNVLWLTFAGVIYWSCFTIHVETLRAVLHINIVKGNIP